MFTVGSRVGMKVGAEVGAEVGSHIRLALLGQRHTVPNFVDATALQELSSHASPFSVSWSMG